MPKKRAICLAGGGPAVGLHIGALKALAEENVAEDHKIKFDVWALSCIGAWVGIVYNQASEGKEVDETTDFFRGVFRDDKSFKSFPTNTIFAPDWAGNAEAIIDFLLEPENYRNAFLPKEIMKSWLYTMSALRRATTGRRRVRIDRGEIDLTEEFREFSEGDFNRWTLNHVLAVNPAVRFLTAMMYKSKITGLSRLYYPDSSFLNEIDFDKLGKAKPFIYHNAWNLTQQKMDLFANRTDTSTNNRAIKGYKRVDAASLCACSALPFIEQTVKIDGDTYCEGALVDTVNFDSLLDDNPDLDEIWVSRLLDAKQISAPKNLYDAQANLCELFAATVGEDDVEIFKNRLNTEDKFIRGPFKKVRLVEVPVSNSIDFTWSHSNLKQGIADGEHYAEQAIAKYREEMKKAPDQQEKVITPPIDLKEIKKKKERAKARLTAAE